MDATIARATRRQIRREGQTIDLILYSAGTATDYGETRNTTTTVTTTAVVGPPSGQRDPDQRGIADEDIDLEIVVDDTDFRPFGINSYGNGLFGTAITGGGGRLASEIDVDQDGTAEYRVMVATDQQNGSLLLECTDIPDN